MITIFPIRKEWDFHQAVKALGAPADGVLEAKDGEELLGMIGFTLNACVLHITALREITPFIVDGLIKSALSYAGQRGIPLVTVAAGRYEDCFLSVGFEKKDTLLTLSLDTFTHKCNF